MASRWMLAVALCTVLLYVSAAVPARAGEPQDKVRETVDAVLLVLQDKTMQGPEQTAARREKMRQAVFKRFGFDEMAQRALGQYWRQRTPAERQAFTTLFGELLERSYINKIESYTGEQNVLYTRETIDQDGYASVRTEIVNPRDLNVIVEYRLLRRQNDWRVYDVVIEGVSLVNNYRTQFHSIISRESFDSLMKRLHLKLEQERAGVSTQG